MRSGKRFGSPQRLFRRRTVLNEYCFDHTMISVACNGNPYAEL